MISIFSLLPLLLLLFTLLPQTNSNDVRRLTDSSCLAVYHQVWCVGVGLKQVPVLPAQSHNATTYLDISRNSITSISWQLQRYPFLHYLNVANNSLADISADAFKPVTSLTELNLSWNQLTTNAISDDTFEPLSNLKLLTFSNNLLGPTFSILTFRHQHKVTSLDLDYNNIVHLTGCTDNSSIQSFPSLTELRLKGNFLVAIPHHIWSLAPQLILLDLSENEFQSIPSGSLSGVNALKILLLNNISSLKSIEPLAVSCDRIKDLEISGNHNLFSIQPGAFINCHDLEILHLENNGLETLPSNLFPWAQLKHVSLYGNKWRCDCNATWLMYLTKTGKLVSGKQTKCMMPPYLKHHPVIEMNRIICFPHFNQTGRNVFNAGQIIAITLPTVLATFILVLLGIKCFQKLKMKQPELLGAPLYYGSLYESQNG